MNQRTRRLDEIVGTALEIADPLKRAAYLEQACAGNDLLRKEAAALLRAHDEAGVFLEEPLSGAPLAQETVVVAATLAEQPGQRIGRYKLLEKIGEGGFGDVWMAEQEEPVHRRVALKIIKLGMDTKEVVARFEAERQALALMDHPHIARIFDGGVTDSGRPYFVMELVRGTRITDYCDQARLSPPQRLELFIQVCQAVQHAHQKGLIHRDLKPSNILVTVDDAGLPVPKIIDFGITKAVGGRLTEKTLFTRFHEFVGTPAYMSPEQAALTSVDIDTRSDIYSLGVLLYELLTGRTPFEVQEILAAGLDAMRRTICEQEPMRPSTRLGALSKEALTTAARQRHCEALKLLSTVRGDLDWIVMKCLEKDRARRYETANGLGRDLERYLHNEPVVARPPSRLYRWQKFVRKHRAGVAVAAGCALLLTAATAVSTVLALWANRERGRVARAEADAKVVLKFFEEKVLAAPRPEGEEGGRGRNVTLREAVGAVEKEIGASFRDSPLVEASIRQVLGKTFFVLGEHSTAIQQLERAVALMQQQLGPDDPVMLEAMHALAVMHDEAGRSDLAVSFFEPVLASRKARLGTNAVETLRAMAGLGGAYRSVGRHQEALPLLEGAVEGLAAQTGPDSPETLEALNQLAMAYFKVGRLNEVVRLFERILRLRRALPRSTPSDLLSSMINLFYVYMEAGRFDDAARLIEEAVALALDKFGPENPSTLNALGHRAWLAVRRGHLQEGITRLQEVVRLRKARQGTNHIETAGAMEYLGVAYLHAEKPEDAAPLFEEVLRVRNDVLGPDHEQTHSALVNLGVSYMRAKRLEEAVPLLDEALAKLRSKFGANHPSTINILGHCGWLYTQTGRREEGFSMLEEAVRLRKTNQGPDHVETAGAMNYLAIAYSRAERIEEALPLFLEVLRIRRASLGPNHPQTLSAVEDLAAAHVQAGHSDRALSLLEETWKGAGTNLVPDHPQADGEMRNLRLKQLLQRLVDLYHAKGLAEPAAAAQRKLAELDHQPNDGQTLPKSPAAK